MLPSIHHYEPMADYHQVVVMDDRDVPFPEHVDEEDCLRRLTVAPGIVVIHTARNMPVPFAVELLDAPPADLEDGDGWDHVTECSLVVTTGRIVVTGLLEYLPDAPRIDLPPGAYRLRALHRGLGEISPDGLEGRDAYLVRLWRAGATAPEVLRQW